MLLKCSIGNYIEKLMMKTDKPDLSHFTMEKYETITKYKTSYHTFQMPVTLALLMTGVDDVETHRQAKTILLKMGEFFQIQVSIIIYILLYIFTILKVPMKWNREENNLVSIRKKLDKIGNLCRTMTSPLFFS